MKCGYFWQIRWRDYKIFSGNLEGSGNSLDYWRQKNLILTMENSIKETVEIILPGLIKPGDHFCESNEFDPLKFEPYLENHDQIERRVFRSTCGVVNTVLINHGPVFNSGEYDPLQTNVVPYEAVRSKSARERYRRQRLQTCLKTLKTMIPNINANSSEVETYQMAAMYIRFVRSRYTNMDFDKKYLMQQIF